MKKLLPYLLVLVLLSTGCKKIFGEKIYVAIDNSIALSSIHTASDGYYLNDVYPDQSIDEFEDILEAKLKRKYRVQMVALNEAPDFVITLDELELSETKQNEQGCDNEYDLFTISTFSKLAVTNTATKKVEYFELLTEVEDKTKTQTDDDGDYCELVETSVKSAYRNNAEKAYKIIWDKIK